MTNKELREKISQLFGYFDNTEFGDVISFTRAGKEKEVMDLIREVVESVIPEYEKPSKMDNEFSKTFNMGWNNLIKRIKDNLDKLLKV